MIEMVLFHHHSSIYNEDWSKPGFGRVCSNPRYIYYFLIHSVYISEVFQLVFSEQKSFIAFGLNYLIFHLFCLLE